MLIDAVSDSRAVAAMMPTGAEALQTKDRARQAGTEGPPIQALTRFDRVERTGDADRRPVALGRSTASEPTTDADFGSVVSFQLQRNDDAVDNQARVDEQRQAEMAKVAFEQTQELNRQQTEKAAKVMRERY